MTTFIILEREKNHFIQWRMCLWRMGVDVGVGVWVRRGAYMYIGVFGCMHIR